MANTATRSTPRQQERSMKLWCNVTPVFDTHCFSLLGPDHDDSGHLPRFCFARHRAHVSGWGALARMAGALFHGPLRAL
jgi:hypothetical protein